MIYNLQQGDDLQSTNKWPQISSLSGQNYLPHITYIIIENESNEWKIAACFRITDSVIRMANFHVGCENAAT